MTKEYLLKVPMSCIGCNATKWIDQEQVLRLKPVTTTETFNQIRGQDHDSYDHKNSICTCQKETNRI